MGVTIAAQCVIYNGPDLAHIGEEICFNAHEDTVTIVDVADKISPPTNCRAPPMLAANIPIKVG